MFTLFIMLIVFNVKLYKEHKIVFSIKFSKRNGCSTYFFVYIPSSIIKWCNSLNKETALTTPFPSPSIIQICI